MDRVIAARRFLLFKRRDIGPLIISSDPGLPAKAIGEFLDACYIAVDKIRSFGFEDADFAGKIHLSRRKGDEKANGRYIPKEDKSIVFYPNIRGVPDLPWTITHELSHRIWHNKLDDVSRELWSRVTESMGKPITPSAADALARMVMDNPDRYSLWFFFKKHFSEDPELFKRWLTTRSVSYEFPTEYANSNPSEAFADVFADLVLGRAHAGKGMRRTGAFMRKVFLDVVKSLRGSPRFNVFEDYGSDPYFLQSQMDLPTIKASIDEWVGRNLAGSEIVKAVNRPHVTIVHGLDKRDMDRINKIAADYGRPIRIVTGAINYFEKEDYDVLYIEAIGSSLIRLNKELSRLPNTRYQDEEGYTPHISIAYVKKGSGRRFVGSVPVRSIVSRDGFSLIDSDGIETHVKTIPNEEPVLIDSRD